MTPAEASLKGVDRPPAIKERATKLPRCGDGTHRIFDPLSGIHLLHHCQKSENTTQCYDKGSGDSFSPSAPSILSNLSEACFDRGVLCQ